MSSLLRKRSKFKFNIRSFNSNLANFVSYGEDAKIALVTNNLDNHCNVVHIGNSYSNNEAYISINDECVANFTNQRINLFSDTYVQGCLLPSANLYYDLGQSGNEWKDLYLTGSIRLNSNLSIYNESTSLQVETGLLDKAIVTSYDKFGEPVSSANIFAWTDHNGYMKYGNIYVYPDKIQVRHLIAGNSFPINVLTEHINVYKDDRECIVLNNGFDMMLENYNWSTFTYFSISGWFKLSGFQNNDIILAFFNEDANISIVFYDNKLVFSVNSIPIYEASYNGSWVHIVWNIKAGNIKIDNVIIDTESTDIISTIYTNIIGSIFNVGNLYVSDFKIYTSPEDELYNSAYSFTTLVDDKYIDNMMIDTSNYIERLTSNIGRFAAITAISDLWKKDADSNIYYTEANVGIGKSAPAEKLDVDGNIKVTGSINDITNEQLGYLVGVTSSVQSQFDTVNTRIDALDSNMSETDAAINTRIDTLTADGIDDGPNEKRFIVNDVYNRDLSVLGTLTTSNIDVFNKLHIGNSTYNDENIIVSLLSSNSFRTLYTFYDNKYIDKKSGFETSFNYTYNDSNIYWGQIGNPYNTGKLSIVSNSSHSEISLSFWSKYRYSLDIPSQGSVYSSVTVVATGFNNGNRLWRILFSVDSASKRSIIVQYLAAPYDKTSSLQTKATYTMGPDDSFENLNFWTFNLSNSRIEIFKNAVMQHSVRPIDPATFNAQPFITTEAYIEEKGVETFFNFNQNWQRFLYKDVAYFSKVLQRTEVSLLYKYLSNAIIDSVKVYGKIRCDSIDAKGIYKDGVLLSYNSKALFQGPGDTDKITVQNKGTRRSISIDAIEVNSTSNLINNSSSSGYIYYSDSSLDTIPQIRLISYQHLTDVPSTFEPSFHTHNIEDITGLTSSIEHTSNILQGQIDMRTTKEYVEESLSSTSNILQNSINNFAILSDSIWTNTGKYIYYSNIYVYANEVRSKNPVYIDTNPYIRYKFDTLELLTIDESLNSLDIIQNNGGEYRFNENKNSLYFRGASYAKIPYIDWYKLSYFTIAGWFKIDTKETANVLLDFVYESEYYIDNHTSNLLFWYKFEGGDYADCINYGILGSAYNLINPAKNSANYNTPSYLASIVELNQRINNLGSFIEFTTNPNYDSGYEYEEYRQNAGITRLDMLLHAASYDFTNMKNFTISFVYIINASGDSFQTIIDINSKLYIYLEISQGKVQINANLFTTLPVNILNIPVTQYELNHYAFAVKSLKTYVEFKFYLNGNLFYVSTFSLTNFNPSSGSIIINNTSSYIKCVGYLGDFRIYNRSLAPVEIQQIYKTFRVDIMDIFRPNIKISNKIIADQPKLFFEANMQEVYNTPYVNNSWVHIVWNTQEGYIKINNQIVYTNYINIIPVTYANYLGNAGNVGDIYISDFHILNKTISAAIETQLYNGVIEYYKFVDDIFFKSYIANALPAEVNDYVVSQNIVGTLTTYIDSTSNSITQHIQHTSNMISEEYISYVEQASNQIRLDYIEYDKISSNNLIEHITITSNILTSNYIQYADIIAANLVTTIHTASNNLIEYIDKVALELISIELSGNSSDLYNYVDTSVARSFATIDQVWERNGSTIYYQDGPVLVGQSTPNQLSIPNTNLDVAGNTVIRNDLHIFGSSSNYGQLFVAGETNSSNNSLTVKGKLRCDTLSLDYIYKDGESLPLNSTTFYIGSKQQGKVTLQNDGDRRMLSIDTITLNSVNNLVNDTGSWGYLHFINPGISTICQVKAISYSELSDRPTIFSGNYADLNGAPTSFNPSAHTHTISNITGLTEAFINTSNYAYQLSSNLQDNVNNKWKIDSSCNLYYTSGKIGIGTSSFVDGAILNVKGIVTLQDQTVLGNAALTDETTINTMLNDISLLHRFYVKSGFVRNVLTSTDYYYPNTIQGIDEKIWGRITYNSGNFEVCSEASVSQSANISLYIYLPVALTFPFQNNTEFTCIVAVSESFRILLANGVYNNVTKTRVQVQYFIKTYEDEILQSQSWNTKLYYELGANELLTVPHHFAFNITERSAKIYMDGNLKASATISSDGIYNFGISTVQIVSYGDTQNNYFQQSHQNFAWKDAWLFNRALSDYEVHVLYKFLNNSINETLKVYGKIICDSIDAKVIYKNNEPIIYNKKDLFEGTKEIGKITVQNKGTRRSISIDAIEVNSTSNIVNNSGSKGYLYYSNSDQDTIAQIKVITYNDLAQIPSTFAPSPHTHLVSDISGLSQSFTDTSNYVKTESNLLRGLINDKENAVSLTSNRALISDANGKLAVSSIASTQLGYLTGLTQNISTSLGAKENTIFLTSNRALISDDNGKLAVSSIASTQLGYLSDVASNIGAALNAKENTIGLLPVSKGGTSISTILANQLLGSGSTANTIQAITVSTGLSLENGVLIATGSGTTSSTGSSSPQYWTSNTGYVSYNNVHVFPNEIRINTPTLVSLDSYLQYEFKSSSDLIVDSSKNKRTLINNGGTYSLTDNKNSILFSPTKYANISNQDWSVFSDLTISGWFKKSTFETNDIIYNFSFLPASFLNITTNLLAWYKFDSSANILDDSSENGNTLVSNNNATFSSTLFKTGSGSIQFDLDLRQFATLPSLFNLYNIWANAALGITISFWFKTNTNPDKREARVFSIASTDIIIFISLVKTADSTSVYSVKLTVAYATGSASSTYSVNNVQVNQWHHIVLSIYKTSTLIMHLDNVHHNPVISNVRFINSSTYIISVGENQGYQYADYDYVKLNIDDFRFYNTILTAWQIYELYYFTIQTQNIKLSQNFDYLKFEINSKPVVFYQLNNSWNHIIWNVTNSTSDQGFIKINNETKQLFDKITLYPGNYSNTLGSNINQGSIYISDFRILTTPVTTMIENSLYASQYAPVYTTLVDDLYVSATSNNIIKYVDNTYKNGKTTSNLVNNTGSKGYLYYSTTDVSTIAQVKTISYNELTDKPETPNNVWSTNLLKIYTTSTSVGIGTNNPYYTLDIQGPKPIFRILDNSTDVIGSSGDITFAGISLQKANPSAGYDLTYSRDDRFYIKGYNSTTIRYDLSIDNATGNVGIGIQNPGIYKLNVNGSAFIKGSLYAQDDIAAYYSVSDERIKTVTGKIENALEIINELSTFKYKTDNALAKMYGFNGQDTYLGVSAQEVQKSLPEIVKIAPFDSTYENDKQVSKSGNNYMTVQYEKMVPVLIEAIKELTHKYNELEKYVKNK